MKSLLKWQLLLSITTTTLTSVSAQGHTIPSEDFDLTPSSSSDDDEDAVVRLMADNIYELTVDKRVFLDFYDPMWGHCLLMAEEWSELSNEFVANKDILIGKMDCTKPANAQICKEDFGVTSYPTLLYGDISNLKVYPGLRELDEFRKVVETHLLTPLCGVANPELCDPIMKQTIQELKAKGAKKLDAEIQEIETNLKTMDEKVNAFRQSLGKKFKSEQRNTASKKADLQIESIAMEEVLRYKKRKTQ